MVSKNTSYVIIGYITVGAREVRELRGKSRWPLGSPEMANDDSAVPRLGRGPGGRCGGVVTAPPNSAKSGAIRGR